MMSSEHPFHDQHLVERVREIDRALHQISPEVIGDRLRRMRLQQSLSVRELASRAEISKTSLVRIEHGNHARPTTILALCSALGIHIQRVLTPADDDLVIASVHHDTDARWHDLREFTSGPLGGGDGRLNADDRAKAARDGAIPLCMLESRLPDSEVLPCVIELFGPTDVRQHIGTEFVFVIDGALRITIGDRTFELRKADSISFRSVEPHSYAPADGSALPARILSVRIDDRATSSPGDPGPADQTQNPELPDPLGQR